MKKFFLISVSLLMFFGLVSIIQAEETGVISPSVEMQKTVVTATRTETPLEDLPVSVTVITAEEIEKIPATTVDEVLNRVAGMQVRRNKGLCNTTSHTTVYMRGTADSSRVLVLKDGIPINRAYGGTVTLWNTLSLENIERIEIVRGASSALYGSSAMGGVINIITKSPEEGLSGSASLQGGSFDTYIGSASVNAGTDKQALRASVEHKRTGGYEYYKGNSWKNYYQKPENELTNISVGGDVWLGKSILRLDYAYLLEESLSATTTQYDGEQETNEYMLSWGVPLGKVDFSVKAYYYDEGYVSDADSYNSASGEFDKYYYRSSIPKDEYGMMFQVGTELAGHKLTAGSDLKGAECKSEYAYDSGDRNFSGKQDFYSFFANDEVGFLEDTLIFNVGLRYDHWENHDGDFYDSTTSTVRNLTYPEKTDEAFSPKVGIAYKFNPDVKLRASFGTGFKAPSLYDLYKSGPHGATRFDLANPDLEPEKMEWSYDVGFDATPNENLFVSMTFYQSSIKDFLGEKTLTAAEVPSWFSPDPGMAVIQTINLGRVEIYGVEASLEYKINRRWSASMNHTYNVSKIKSYEQDPTVEGHYLSYTPRHTTKIGVTYDNPDLFTLGVFLTNVGERYGNLENTDDKKLGAYQVVDLKISREIIKGLEAFAEVNNLTDEDYEEYSGTYNPPISVMAGVKYTF